MIEHSFSIGKIFITDTSFGHVGVGDKTFPDRFQKRFGFAPKQIAWMDQVHGTQIQYAGKSDEGRVFPKTDGLWTDQKEILLITKTADCVPILLWNEQERVIADLHCGWRGFFAGIIESFAECCTQKGFSLPGFSVFLGPHLRVEDFKVQQDFIDQIPSPKRSFLMKKGKAFHYDITAGVVKTLRQFGITDIVDCGINTYNASDYFSYRRWSQAPVNKRPSTYSTFANTIVLN